MEIEKICRTCLGLSGPLLSIFDNDSFGDTGTGCLANMLSEFTKTKPKRADNLPEKVCLTCISEINRCYSFKLKCENSNRTLRQLLPDALPEEPDSLHFDKKEQVAKINKSVQTITETPKEIVSTAVQTVKEEQPVYVHQKVQTEEGASNAAAPTHIINGYTQKKLQLEKVVHQETLEEFIDCERRRSKRRRTTKQQESQLIVKRKRTESPVIEEDQSDSEIILELHDVSEATDNERKILEQVDDEGNHSYYEISQLNYEEVDAAENNAPAEKTDTLYEEDEEYSQLIYSDKNGSDKETNETEADYKYTVFNNEDGEEEIKAKRSTRSTRTKEKLRLEYKCTECMMSFFSVKSLKRHKIKRHDWVPPQAEAGNEHDMKQGEPTSSFVLTSEIQATLLQQLQEEIELEQKNATDTTPIESTEIQPVPETTPQAAEEPTVPSKLLHFCDRCNAGFALRKSLNYHRKLSACTAKTYKCSECERVFMSEEHFNEHKASHNLGNACTECNKLLKTKEELTQHMIDEHKRNIRNQCNICKKVFTMLSALKDHMRIHSGEKPYLCTTCGKAFSQNANLKQHIMRHSKEKKFKCDECSNSYVTKAELYSHKRTHTGDQPFKCYFCEASFTTSSSLVKHKRKHTGERPYACDICPMRFTALNVLKNHRRTHTGEKPFKCVFCNKGFTQKGDCQIHQRTHTGERKYGCFCGEKFTHLGTLRTHMKLHNKDIDKKPEMHDIPENAEEVHIILDDIDEPMVVSVKSQDGQVAPSDEDLVQIAMDDMC